MGRLDDHGLKQQPPQLSGVLPVLVTSFDDSQAILYSDLTRQVEWLLRAGVAGLVYPGMASEFFTLSETERRRGVETVVSARSSDVPVVVGVSATSGSIAADLAGHAEESGANAVMAMLPYVGYFFTPSSSFSIEYFKMIAAATSLPIIIQNPRIGARLSKAEIGLILDTIPTARYVKEEGMPNTHALGSIVDSFAKRLDGVFGGLGTIYLTQELVRGASGTMPSPALADQITRAWQLWLDGMQSEAAEIASRLGELHTYEILYNISYIKHVLHRRGVISSSICRVPAPALDAPDSCEINRLLEAAGLID
jgi:4-hydroxy-tetrahydrodipicolinate synthase